MTTHPTWSWALLVLPLVAAGGGVAPSRPEAAPAPEAAVAETFGSAPDIRFADDPADTLYQTAREALSRGNYREAARLFRRIVDEEPGSEHAPDALYWQAFSLYRAGGQDALDEAVHALNLQAERYPDAATRGDAQALMVRIRGALARRGDAEAAESVGRTAEGAAGCPVEDDDVRLAALNALMEMDPERAVPILEKVLALRGACSLQLRRHAVFIVAESDTERATDILLDVARNDPDAEVRVAAVHWLSEVESPRAFEALMEILNNASDVQLLERALYALSEQESSASVEALRRFAADERRSEDLREKAIYWLAETEDPRTLEFLQDLYGRLESTGLRERILYAAAEA
ncbi:MAG TPA: HEAT repeat domain-containing protein, partial [Gemmatimonadota bacterium]|nr:HEAT repeat domain-containing protein [Gemmatimonadota bacterium]